MNRTALVLGIRINFIDRINKTKAYVADKKLSTFETSLFKAAQKAFPALPVPFHALCYTDHFSKSFFVYSQSNKHCYILRSAALASILTCSLSQSQHTPQSSGISVMPSKSRV